MSLEALAINYLTHTLWTWLAFLTTSFSFWRTNSYSPPHHNLSPRLSSPSPPQSLQTVSEPDPDDGLPSTISRFSSSPTSNYTKIATVCSLENRRSGKFRVYYYGENEIRDVERRTMGSVRVEENERVNVSVDGWEAVLKLKTAEMGWYRYQDLTVLDGNVVKLWNHSLL